MNLVQLIVKKRKLSEEASSYDELSEAAKPSDLACNFDVLKFDGENCRKAIARTVMVLAITVDNSSVYGDALIYVKRKVNDWSGNAMLLDGEWRFSCDNPKVEEMIKEVKEPLSRLYELYNALNTSGETKAPIDAQASGTDMENGKDKDDSEWRSSYKKYLKGKYGTKYLLGTNEFFEWQLQTI